MNNFQSKYEFSNYDDGTCELIVDFNFFNDEFNIPKFSPEGKKIVAIKLKERKIFKKVFIPKTLKSISFLQVSCYDVEIDTLNPYYNIFDGVVFDKEIKTLIYCPLGKTGKFIVPASMRKIKDGAFSYEDCKLHEVIF